MSDMAITTVGILHPGAMGAAIGRALHERGVAVYWASAGRSDASRARAEDAGLTDAGTVAVVLKRCGFVLSVCPPHAALDVATLAAGYRGVYIDANAVSPATVRKIAGLLGSATTVVDGSIIGPPPRSAGDTRLYLSGPAAGQAQHLFTGTSVDARIVGQQLGAASSVKAAYAAWTKGSAALLLTARTLAAAEGVESTLLDEWEKSQPQLRDQHQRAAAAAASKGWRWAGEMEEIAAAMRAAGLPDGFHRSAAEIYRTWPQRPNGVG
jgi:3-hydroxyisobutyrate dehydrogenase-like beta-hydroxyacid dehydrogenase